MSGSTRQSSDLKRGRTLTKYTKTSNKARRQQQGELPVRRGLKVPYPRHNGPPQPAFSPWREMSALAPITSVAGPNTTETCEPECRSKLHVSPPQQRADQCRDESLWARPLKKIKQAATMTARITTRPFGCFAAPPLVPKVHRVRRYAELAPAPSISVRLAKQGSLQFEALGLLSWFFCSRNRLPIDLHSLHPES